MHEEGGSRLEIVGSGENLLTVAVSVTLSGETLICCIHLLECDLCSLLIAWVLVRVPGNKDCIYVAVSGKYPSHVYI